MNHRTHVIFERENVPMKKLPFLLPLFLLAIVLISGSTALSTTTAQDDCEIIYVRPDIVTVDLTGYPDGQCVRLVIDSSLPADVVGQCPAVSVAPQYHQDDEDQGVTGVDFAWAPGASGAVWYRVKIWTPDLELLEETTLRGSLGYLMPVSTVQTAGDYILELIAETEANEPLCSSVAHFTVEKVYQPPAPPVIGPPPCTDADADGYCAEVDDCDDGDASIHPGAVDTFGDGIDQDCNGIDFPGTDADADGYLAEVDDCDDSDVYVHPGATEVPGDGIDQDCDGIDPPGTDADTDGYLAEVDDCDDGDASIHPGATDVAGDGIDQDCSGSDASCPVGQVWDYNAGACVTPSSVACTGHGDCDFVGGGYCRADGYCDTSLGGGIGASCSTYHDCRSTPILLGCFGGQCNM
jgi:hypothetical protein